jgi:predicted nucleic acid-binding protein
MILYLDTSALVKRYFLEQQSDGLLSRWVQAELVVTSSVAYAETVASYFRKKREAAIEDEVIQQVLEAFFLDWKSFLRVEVTDELNEIVLRVVESYPLRGFDAIHLASAVLTRGSLPNDFLFACFDQRMAQAAREEKFATFPS